RIARERLLRAALSVDEQPAHVRVEQPPQGAAPAPAVADVGTVRVTLLVGERVVLAVVGDPGDHRPLDRRRSQGREYPPQRSAGLEAAVGEESVEADRDPEPGDEI